MQDNNYVKELKKNSVKKALLKGMFFIFLVMPWSLYANDSQVIQNLSDRFISAGYEVGYRHIVSSDRRFIEVDDHVEYGLSTELKFSDLYSISVLAKGANPDHREADQDIDYQRYSLVARRFNQVVSDNPACCWRGFLGLGISYSDIESLNRSEGITRSDKSYSGIISAGLHRRLGRYFLVEGGSRLAIDLNNGTAELNPFVAMKLVLPVFQTISIKSQGYRAGLDITPSKKLEGSIPSLEIEPLQVTSQRKTKSHSFQPVKPTVASENSIDNNADSESENKTNSHSCETIFEDVDEDIDYCGLDLKIPIRKNVNLLFESGQKDLRPESFIEIKKISQLLKKFPATQLTVIGHTDNIGDTNENKKLSLDRAVSVKDLLVQAFGISPSRIDTVGQGESTPLYRNNSVTNRQLNRRIEIIIEPIIDIVETK